MKIFALASFLFLAPGEHSPAVALNTGTLQAWDTYIETSRSRMEERLTGAKPFLWIEESEERRRLVRGGAIPVEPMDGNGRTVVAGGLIHDWIGAVFVPATTPDQVVTKLDRYEDYRDFYKPTVIECRLLSRERDSRRYLLRYTRKVSFVTTIIDADYETRYFRPSPDRWWSVSQSTRIQEVEHRGRRDERLQPIGEGAGYLWRYYSITRVMEVDHGVVLEMETIALSRDIPAAVAWFVNPIVDRISRSTLITSLSQTRAAITR
jgi:hypothetical protein